MLPVINLLSPELQTFDNALNNMNLLPSDAVLPDAGFSDLLSANLGELPQTELLPGELLPMDGNELPPVAVEQAMEPFARIVVAIPPEGLPQAPHGVGLLEAPVAEPGSLDQRGASPMATIAQLASDANAVRGEQAPVVAADPDAGVPALELRGSAAQPQLQRAVVPSQQAIVPSQQAVAQSQQAPQATTQLAPTALSQAMTLANGDGEPSGSASDNAAQDSGRSDSPRQPVSSDTSSLRSFESAREEVSTQLRGWQQAGQQPQASQITQATLQPASPSAVTPVAPQVSTPASVPLQTPVTDPAWGEQVGERVVLMAGKQLQNAEIRLSPAELGPLRVQVRMDDGGANVTFHASHAVTREAIEQALPRLREMLAENGLNLGQANVSEQGVGHQAQTERDPSGQHVAEAAVDGDPQDSQDAETVNASGSRRVIDGLVDTFV